MPVSKKYVDNQNPLVSKKYVDGLSVSSEFNVSNNLNVSCE